MIIFRSIISLFLLSLLICPSAIAKDVTFHGKVIDAETLEPIEGALIIARWDKSRADIPGSTVEFQDAKETLTDKNGDWELTGPRGNTETYNKDHNRIISFIFRKFYLRNPYFIIYKPGYWSNRATSPEGPVSYEAYPCVSKDLHLEGIILIRMGDTWGEARAFNERYGYGFLPFIPVKNPEKKLRELDFSFQYPENVEKVYKQEIRKRSIEPYWVYTVLGLKKATTRQERLKAMSPLLIGEGLPISTKMEKEERERLLGPGRRK